MVTARCMFNCKRSNPEASGMPCMEIDIKSYLRVPLLQGGDQAAALKKSLVLVICFTGLGEELCGLVMALFL